MKKKYMNHVLFRRKRVGFTLIELLVVITVIGILITLVTVSIRPIQAKSRDARRKSDINLMLAGLNLFKSDFKIYPNHTMNLGLNSADPGAVNSNFDLRQDVQNCQALTGAGNPTTFASSSAYDTATIKEGFGPINNFLVCLNYIDKAVTDPSYASTNVNSYQYRVSYDYTDMLVAARLERDASDMSYLFDNTGNTRYFVGTGKTVPQLNDDSDTNAYYTSLTFNRSDGYYLYQCLADAATGTALTKDQRTTEKYEPIKIQSGSRVKNTNCSDNASNLWRVKAYGN